MLTFEAECGDSTLVHYCCSIGEDFVVWSVVVWVRVKREVWISPSCGNVDHAVSPDDDVYVSEPVCTELYHPANGGPSEIED